MSEDRITIDPPGNLQKKLREHLKSTGAISSGDVASFQRGEAPAEERPDGAAMEENTVIEASTPRDPLIAVASDGDTGSRAIQETMAEERPAVPGFDQAMDKRKIVITPADKEAFISSVINNTRMELTFPILGGKVNVTVRSRKVPETQAVVARERFEIADKTIVTQFDYTLRVRSMLMAAQIAEYRGEKYEELQEPLKPVAQVGDAPATAPGWVKWIDHWADCGDAVHAMLWNCIQAFEDKYWRMVEDAQNTDFWKPVASTSE